MWSITQANPVGLESPQLSFGKLLNKKEKGEWRLLLVSIGIKEAFVFLKINVAWGKKKSLHLV